jgi:hypothetical protein
VSEREDAKSILRMLLEHPSNLGKKELARLNVEGWKMLAVENPDLERMTQIITRLREGRQRGRGRKLDSVARNTKASDRLVLQEIKNGATVEKAIRKVYELEDYEDHQTHERRIKRRKREVKSLSAPRGDIK